MEAYQGTMSSYEPSADELIDVLKNLENLAAINPALYRAIVDQIKGRILKKLEIFSYSMGICCFFVIAVCHIVDESNSVGESFLVLDH